MVCEVEVFARCLDLMLGRLLAVIDFLVFFLVAIVYDFYKIGQKFLNNYETCQKVYNRDSNVVKWEEISYCAGYTCLPLC